MKHAAVFLALFLCAAMTGCAAVSGSPAEASTYLSSTAPGVSTLVPCNTGEGLSPAASATPHFAIALTKLPKRYTPETAAANGDYVDVQGSISNAEKLAAFLTAARDGKDAAIRTVKYTVEGDPIISDVIFEDGSFTVWEDATRDKFGEREITRADYLHMVEYRYEDRKATAFFLTNENEITPAMLADTEFDGYQFLYQEDNP